MISLSIDVIEVNNHEYNGQGRVFSRLIELKKYQEEFQSIKHSSVGFISTKAIETSKLQDSSEIEIGDPVV